MFVYVWSVSLAGDDTSRIGVAELGGEMRDAIQPAEMTATEGIMVGRNISEERSAFVRMAYMFTYWQSDRLKMPTVEN